jgi:hypothetical protein
MNDTRYQRETETEYIGLIEDRNDDIWYIEKWSDIAKSGKKFNERLIAMDDSFTRRFTHRIDDCFSLDECLQQLVEKMKIPL